MHRRSRRRLPARIDRSGGDLEDGRFNCVSSTVLFNCLALRFGLEPVALELPGHAMTRLRLGSVNLDVETTCPGWFQLRHDPRRQAALVAKTLGAGHADSRAGREVSPVELIAMIYYNRGVDLLSEQRFAEAAAANAKALRLDPTSKTARGNLLATLNNWAITVGAEHQYEEAIRLLSQGLALDRRYETFRANYIHLHYQWADRLASGNDFDKALRSSPGRRRTARADRLPSCGSTSTALGPAASSLAGPSEPCNCSARPNWSASPPGNPPASRGADLADWAASLARQNRHAEAVSLLDWAWLASLARSCSTIAGGARSTAGRRRSPASSRRRRTEGDWPSATAISHQRECACRVEQRAERVQQPARRSTTLRNTAPTADQRQRHITPWTKPVFDPGRGKFTPRSR